MKYAYLICAYFTWISCETRFTCNSREIFHMNFTWNEFHMKFTWQFHVKFTWNKFHVKFMWNSRENFTWISRDSFHVKFTRGDFACVNVDQLMSSLPFKVLYGCRTDVVHLFLRWSVVTKSLPHQHYPLWTNDHLMHCRIFIIDTRFDDFWTLKLLKIIEAT